VSFVLHTQLFPVFQVGVETAGIKTSVQSHDLIPGLVGTFN
jgi:hypothetical protein